MSSEDKNTPGIGIGRRDDAFSAEEAVRLFHQLVELKRQTGPGEAGIAGGKDHAAEEALTKTSRLVDIICGWAIDHKIGLAVREVSILSEEIKDLANAEKWIDINADDVALEWVGSLYHEDVTEKSHSGEITHAALAKILPLLFERLPSAIFARVGTAFWLLSRGEKSDFLEVSVTKTPRPVAETKLQLRAVGCAFFLYAATRISMEEAFRQVADKYGVNFETVRNWRKRLPKRDSVTHATIAVWEREAKQLRNMASRDGRPTEPSEAKPSASRFTGDRFGPEALERASSSYRTLIGSKQSGT